LENELDRLVRQGKSAVFIKDKLKLPLMIVLLYTKDKYSVYAETKRNWYQLRYKFRASESDVFEFREETLPPAARLGMDDGALSDMPNKRRCSRCHTLNFIPDEFTLCLACRTKLILQTRKFPELPPDTSEEEIDPFRRHLLHHG
jgi:hypothetical protein